MSAIKKSGVKINKFKIIRIITSLILPTLFGIVFYSLLTGIYGEPLFWLGIIFIIAKLYLLMLLPSLIFTVVMEYLGIKLLQNPVIADKLLLNSLLFLAGGALTGGFIGFLLGSNSRSGLYIVGLLTGLFVTIAKTRYHLLERKLKYGSFRAIA